MNSPCLWNIEPGDFVELATGGRGTVLATCKLAGDQLIAVEVGFEWFNIEEIVSWVPNT